MTDTERLMIIETLIQKHIAGVSESDDPYSTVYEDSGGNYDDAFALGVSRGYYELAREIYRILN